MNRKEYIMARDERKVEVKAVGGTVKGQPIRQPAQQTQNAQQKFGRK
jgi:hypothetical protein